jgi:voltage-gated potassium channel
VKFLFSQMMATLTQPDMRTNVRAFLRYLAVLGISIAIFSVLFHVLMVYEGQDHSWLTGLYWTMTVMSTLGFGDITFHSDLGRLFTIIVLTTGIVLMLIVLPFAFIRHFYAPWLEAQVRVRAPRSLPPEVRGHVIFCSYDELARATVERLSLLDTPYVVIEPDPVRCLALLHQGMSVVNGERDAADTYAAVRADAARLVVANVDDPTNTNITLTVRERAPKVPIVAIAADKDAVDILELSGATQVVAVKHRLGDQLVGRLRANKVGVHIVGRYKSLAFAEVPARDAELVGMTIGETRLRERAGVSVVAYWERGHLMPARATATLTEDAVLVIVGTEEHLVQLDAFLPDHEEEEGPVLVIGGGRVGRAALRALRRRGLRSVVIEVDPALRGHLEELADRVVIGDAANIEVMREAGIHGTANVLLTTHDDARNIYVAVYSRKLNPSCRIISRITHERNLEAIHRAGADFVLSEVALGVRAVLAALQNREIVVLGEQVDVFVVAVPPALAGRTLEQSGIGRGTGVTVIGIQDGETIIEAPGASTILAEGTQLLVFGTNEQRDALEHHMEDIGR